MNQTEHIQMAYEICKKMEELSSKLWDHYFDEFIEIILNEDNPYCADRDEIVDDVNF